MADIKTRETVKGTIKTLDKAAIAGQKMKQAYIATKDKAEHSVNTNENTAEEYAADKTEAGIDEIAHKGAYSLISWTKRCSGNKAEYSICKRGHTAFQTAESRKGNERSENARQTHNGW